MSNQSLLFIPTERDAEHTINLLREKKRYLEGRLMESEAMYHTLLGMYMKLREAMIGDDDDDLGKCHRAIGCRIQAHKSKSAKKAIVQ